MANPFRKLGVHLIAYWITQRCKVLSAAAAVCHLRKETFGYLRGGAPPFPAWGAWAGGGRGWRTPGWFPSCWQASPALPFPYPNLTHLPRPWAPHPLWLGLLDSRTPLPQISAWKEGRGHHDIYHLAIRCWYIYLPLFNALVVLLVTGAWLSLSLYLFLESGWVSQHIVTERWSSARATHSFPSPRQPGNLWCQTRLSVISWTSHACP